MTFSLRGLVVGVGLCSFACGGSEPAPADAHSNARRQGAERAKAQAERTKASRIAKLETDEPAERMPESVVQVSLEPLVTGVRPGHKFLLAAHFRIAPGYRISWKNPGDVGKETVVEFRGPEGFEIGRANFPVPERYTVPGGYVGFGYQNEMAVFAEVKAPATLSRGRVHRFDLSASWVACKKECATEHTDAFVELATTYGNAAAKEVESGLSPFKARLPKPLSDVKDAEQKWDTAGRDATLLVKVPGSTLRDFMPEAKFDPAPKKMAMSGDELKFVFDSAPRPGWRPLRGLLVASADGGEAYYDLEVAAPGEDRKSSSAEPSESEHKVKTSAASRGAASKTRARSTKRSRR